MKPASATRSPVRAPKARPAARAPQRRLWLLAAAVGLALLVAGILVLANRGGSSAPSQPVSIGGAAETAALLAGIPQRGNVLGSPNAPLTLVEYADLQCPYCGRWAVASLPTIVRDYVRAGRVRIEFRGLHFVGPDSEAALRTALAAAPAGKLWNVVDLLYRNQGTENTGWVTTRLLRSVVAAAGLDSGSILAKRSSAEVDRLLAQASADAQADGIQATPSFELGPTGGPLRPLQLTTLDPRALAAAIDAFPLR